MVWLLALPTLAATGTRQVHLQSTPAGASVFLDDAAAAPLAVTPKRRVKVERGVHTFIFRLDGYSEVRQTVDVRRQGQRLQAKLEPLGFVDVTAADAGSHGAEVLIDGLPAGRVPQRFGLDPGRHAIELRKDGHASVVQWAVVERTKTVPVAASFGAGIVGSVIVSADTEGSTVWLDGVQLGPAPRVLESVPVGQHTVEVRAEGLAPIQKTVNIKPGVQETVFAALKGGVGALLVTANVAGAVVSLDGKKIGVVPAEGRGISAGDHLLEITAEGYDTLQETITVESGMRRALAVRMERLTGGGGRARVVVRSAHPDSRLYVDGELIGALPYEGGVPSGSHMLEVRADGFDPWKQRVDLSDSGEARVFDVALATRGSSGSPDDPRREVTVIHSAAAIPPRQMSIDLSGGWVHLLEIRFDAGILPYLDAGLALRTFGRLTEVEARARTSIRPIPLLAIGGQVRLGGGGGADDTNDAFVLVEGLLSFHVERWMAVTAIVGADFYSDAYRFTESDADTRYKNDDRQNTLALRLGAAFELILGPRWNLHARIEWSGVATDLRRVFGDVYGSGNVDAQTFVRFGATIKL